MIGGFLFFLGIWLFILPEGYAPPVDSHVSPSFIVLGLILMIVHCKIIDHKLETDKPDEDSENPGQPHLDTIPSIYLDPLYHAL